MKYCYINPFRIEWRFRYKSFYCSSNHITIKNISLAWRLVSSAQQTLKLPPRHHIFKVVLDLSTFLCHGDVERSGTFIDQLANANSKYSALIGETADNSRTWLIVSAENECCGERGVNVSRAPLLCFSV